MGRKPAGSQRRGRRADSGVDNQAEEADGSGTIADCTYVVGIGASAGGLQPLQEFFGNMPRDSGLAFVVVQHLSPEFKSLMNELLSRHTSMAMHRAEDGMPLQPNSVYLIPPKKHAAIDAGRLVLTEQDYSRGHPPNFPIDHFLQSLAQSLSERAIGVILSGTGSDGTRGARAINEAGGIVLVQDPESAEFDGMPRSVIATGLADYVLSPADVSHAIYDYVTNAPGGLIKGGPDSGLEATLQKITTLVAGDRRIDFSHYKPSTLERRTERRRVISGCASVEEYMELLADSEEERAALRNDLLINVTGFFRDPEAWIYLEQEVIPQLIAQTGESQELRFWVTACSTGEEAYSLAMLVQEALDLTGKTLDVKIFATDIDETALQKAAAGVYNEGIIEDVSPQRVQRFFRKKGRSFQVSRQLREMMIFAPQNLTRDPPFTRMHLVSCRNVLIYMQADLQHQVLTTLHFALQPPGMLFLGAAETVGDLNHEFGTLHQKWKIFQKKRDVRLPMRGGESLLVRAVHSPRVAAPGPDVALGRRLDSMAGEAFGTFLREQNALCLLVTPDHELLQVFGDSRKFLSVPEGKAPLDVTRMVCKPLSLPLSTALHRARSEKRAVSYGGVKVEQDGATRHVDLHISYHTGGKAWSEFLMITLSDAGPAEDAPAVEYDLDSQTAQRITDLEQDLQQTRENLQATIEELETTNEEQQATNQELLASNEELQSTNEELQSVNEELYSVNAEYQSKIQELTDLNNDMDNLLSSTDIGTVFLDADLQIRKFTPAVTSVIKLQDHDVGRPIDQISYGIDMEHDELIAQVKEVLETGGPREFNVASRNGASLLMRVNPYSDEAARTQGVVVTFIDVSEVKRAEESLRRSEERLRQVLESAASAIVMVDGEGHIVLLNGRTEEYFGYSRDELIGEPIEILVPERFRTRHPEYRAGFLADPAARPMGAGRDLFGVRKDGSEFPIEIGLSPVKTDGGLMVLSTIVDITQRVEHEKDRARLAAIVTSSHDAIVAKTTKGKITSWNTGAEQMYGYTAQEAIGRNVSMLLPPDRPNEVNELLHRLKEGEPIEDFETVRQTKDGRRIDVSLTISPLRSPRGNIVGASTIARDITERKRTEVALRESEQRLRLATEAANIGAFDWNIQTGVNVWTPELEAMYGLAPGEFGRTQPAWEQLVHADDRAAAVAAVNRALETGEPVEAEWRIIWRDGSTHWIIGRFQSYKDASGKPLRLTGVNIDVTERNRIETRLRLLQSVTELISASTDLPSAMENALVGICESIGWDYGEAWVPNESHRELDRCPGSYAASPRMKPFSRASSGLTLAPGEGLAGRAWSSRSPAWRLDVSAEPPHGFVRADAAAASGLKGGFAVPIIAGGEVLAVLCFFMTEEPREEDLALVIDLVSSVASQLGSVVQRKKLDANLQQANGELQRKNREMEEFVHTVSHDLKSPLVSIGGTLGILQEELQEERFVDAGDLIATAEQTVVEMRNMIDDLLRLSRIGRVANEVRPVDLREVVNDVLEQHRQQLAEKSVSVEISPELPMVPADRIRLVEVFDNLISNAIKYACDGPAPRIEIGSEADGHETRVFARDYGPGIEPDQTERVFGLFQRLDTTREGTGVGLAIVRRIMEAHSGRVWVESRPGEGATFWLAFPACVRDAATSRVE